MAYWSDGLLSLCCPFIWAGLLASSVGAVVWCPVKPQSSRLVSASVVPRTPYSCLMAYWSGGLLSLCCPFIWAGLLASSVGAFVQSPVRRGPSRCVVAGLVPRAPLFFLMACWFFGLAFFFALLFGWGFLLLSLGLSCGGRSGGNHRVVLQRALSPAPP